MSSKPSKDSRRPKLASSRTFKFDRFLRGIKLSDSSDSLHESPKLSQGGSWGHVVESLLLIRGAESLTGLSTTELQEDAELRRTSLWYKVHRARTDDGKWDRNLFTVPPTSLARPTPYRLRPREESGLKFPEIPLQLLHISPYALPPEVADRSCKDLSVAQLLDELNDVFGTHRTLQDTVDSGRGSIRACLQDFIDDECNLGLVYGYLRRVWWSTKNLTSFREQMNTWKEEDLELRRRAIDSDRVVNPKIPPRRIWDLYSNRVLPFYALGSKEGEIPPNVWAVSHSWIPKDQRRYVRTLINSNEWPIPLPYATALDRVRIELLNMGAEYVFLDILCLRQEDLDSPAHELQRRKEWRIDVPTIGHVYRHSPSQTTIIYPNGLGLPVDISDHVFNSALHWFNRVWTLQEINTRWLLGGLWSAFYEKRKANGERFSRLLSQTLKIVDERPDVVTLLAAIRARSGCAYEVDRVHALGYLLQCPKLPLYYQDMSTEDAWALLVEDLTGAHRLDLLCYSAPGTIDAWRPSWAQAMAHHPSPFIRQTRGIPSALFPQHALDYRNRYAPDLGYTHPSDVYFHRAIVAYDCRIETMKVPSQSTAKKGETKFKVSLPAAQSWGTIDGSLDFSIPGLKSTLHSGSKVVLVRIVDPEIWMMGELTGRRRVGGELAVVVRKIAVTLVPLPQIQLVRTDIRSHETCVVYV